VKKTPFAELVDEALPLYHELNAPGPFGDDRDEKLSAEAYLREALSNARTDQKKIEALDKVVAKLPEDGNKHLLQFVANVQRQAEATRPQDGVDLRPVTGNLHYFVGLDTAAFVGVIVEANAIGSNPLELVALAALRATRDSPESFGGIEDWDKHHAAIEQKRGRLAALYQRIAENWRDAPIEFDQIGGDGRALILVKFRGVTVPAAPPAALGERLCAALA